MFCARCNSVPILGWMCRLVLDWSHDHVGMFTSSIMLHNNSQVSCLVDTTDCRSSLSCVHTCMTANLLQRPIAPAVAVPNWMSTSILGYTTLYMCAGMSRMNMSDERRVLCHAASGHTSVLVRTSDHLVNNDKS